MATVAEQVLALQRTLSTVARERDLLAAVDQSLLALRHAYARNRAEFSAETVSFLVTVRTLHDTLPQFIDALEEKECIATREDAEDLMVRLDELGADLRPFRVAMRVDKEVRELAAAARNLPPAAAVAATSDQRERVLFLEREAPPCSRCGAPRVIRGRPSGRFWGCSTFPGCWSRRWLSKAENELLGATKT